MEHLEAVFSHLQEAGVTAKPRNCQFGMAQCVYLGHIVGGRVKVEMSKVKAIRVMPVPWTKKEVRAFLGLTGYYRKFIPNYASTANPLTDLTQKSEPNVEKWTGECEVAFKNWNELFCSVPVLQTSDFSKPFILQTDASESGWGQF